jgi:hypothetical protein
MKRHPQEMEQKSRHGPGWGLLPVLLLCCLVLEPGVPGVCGSVKIHRAQDETSRSYTWDIANEPENFPDWLRELPVPKGVSGGRRDFQIIPPKAGGNLAITLFFDEPEQGHLRVSWRNPDYGQVLSENLFEGTGLSNQRTVVLDERVLYRPGVLSLLCSEPELPVWRIRFQWLMPRVVLTPSGPEDRAPAALLPAGEVIVNSEMPVSRRLEPEDEWQDDNFTAVLLAGIARLDGGLEIGFELEEVPEMAVVRLQLAGAPLEGSVWLWFGENGAVPVHLALPSAHDGGYRLGGPLSGEPRFAGWRAGTAFVPQRLLREGLNLMRFQFLDAGGTENEAVAAVRDVMLDVRFHLEQSVPTQPAGFGETLPEGSPELVGESGGVFYEDFSLDLFAEGEPPPSEKPVETGIADWNLVPLPGTDFSARDTRNRPEERGKALPVEVLGEDLAPVLQEFLDQHWEGGSSSP